MAKKSSVRSVTSISVSQSLRRRMDKVKSRVNWSAVACAAFEQELAKIDSQKEVRKMKDVIDRLRATKVEEGNDMHEAGYETGQQWAKHDASAKQLKRLDALRGRLLHDWDESFDSQCGSSAYSIAERLFFEIEPNCDGERSEASEFWETAAPDDTHSIEDDDWLRGFADGALAVWGEVKSQV